MAYNNTYGFQAINKTGYELTLETFTEPGGCRDKIMQCRELAAVYDPQGLAINATVNLVCEDAVRSFAALIDVFANSGHNVSCPVELHTR